MKRILGISHTLSDNSLGRAYSMSLVAAEAGFDLTVASESPEPLWLPLRGSAFASKCMPSVGLDAMVRLASDSDVVMSFKPLPESMGVALKIVSRAGVPFLPDADDPDLEALLSWDNPLRRAVRGATRGRYVGELKRLKGTLRASPSTASNPYLGELYQAHVVPHVREDPGSGRVHSSPDPVVAFVGTPRAHKGLAVLREAVAIARRSAGVSLTVTADRPSDAEPWESWVGTTSLAEGLRIVAEADIVVVPSGGGVFPRGQLPVKVVDAMLAGRGVVGSDTPPIRWALGSSGVLVPAQPTPAVLSQAILSLADPATRMALGESARARAVSLFLARAASPALADALREVGA